MRHIRPRGRGSIGAAVLVLLGVTAAVSGGGRAAHARKMTLQQLLDMARAANPSLAAGDAATSAMEAQVSEARRNWLPQGDLLSLLAPSPDIRCLGPADPITGVRLPNTTECITTISP